MAKRGLNKRGSDMLFDQLIPILIIIIFSFFMIMFVSRFGSQTAIKEEIYAKQIALAIDKARAGSVITMDISDIVKSADSNKFKGEILKIDNNDKRVVVHLISGKGYSYSFFSDNNVSWDIDKKEKGKEKLVLHIY